MGAEWKEEAAYMRKAAFQRGNVYIAQNQFLPAEEGKEVLDLVGKAPTLIEPRNTPEKQCFDLLLSFRGMWSCFPLDFDSFLDSPPTLVFANIYSFSFTPGVQVASICFYLGIFV